MSSSGGTLASPTIITAPPASSTTAIVSGTPFHNTAGYDVMVRVPVTYNPTGVAAATLQAVVASASPGAAGVVEESEPASFTVGVIHTSSYYVPNGYYLRLDVSNATLGTATIYPV